MKRRGILFVISAPSGAGKTTLCDRLRGSGEFFYSISCTTRPPRPGEENGRDYHFLTPAEFESKVASGFFLEHAMVHGNRYGTPLEPVKKALEAGQDMLLAIDVQGGELVLRHSDPLIQQSLVRVFLMTHTLAELKRRLQKRGTDSEEIIQKRLSNAKQEMTHWPRYDYVIFTGTPDEDEIQFRHIVQAERGRASRISEMEAFE